MIQKGYRQRARAHIKSMIWDNGLSSSNKPVTALIQQNRAADVWQRCYQHSARDLAYLTVTYVAVVNTADQVGIFLSLA